MELALQGSQITLATRDKATATIAVNYPILLKRPGSASVTLTTPSACLAAANRLNRANSLQNLQPKTNKQIKPPARRASSAEFNGPRNRREPKIDSSTSTKVPCSSRTEPISSSSLLRSLLNEPIKHNTWMTSETETPDISSPSKTASDKAPKGNGQQEKNADPLNINDMFDGSVASMADQIDENIDDVIDEEIETNTDSRSSQSVTLRNDRDEFKGNRLSGTCIDNPIQSNDNTFQLTDKHKKTTVIKPIASSNHPKLNNVPVKMITKPMTINKNGANENSMVETENLTDMSNNIYTTPLPSSSSLALGGFNALKTDLPGRVSFSKSDVYEIDYSDIDNDTDTSRSYDFIESFRKKNVHFEDEYTATKYGSDKIANQLSEMGTDRPKSIQQQSLYENNEDTLDTKQHLSSNMRSKMELSTRLDVLPEDNENGMATTDNDRSEKIIEDYKREIESINRQHNIQLKWNEASASHTDYLPKSVDNKQTSTKHLAHAINSDEPNDRSGSGDSWTSRNTDQDKKPFHSSKTNVNCNTSDESATRDSASTVINNYLKITNQKANNASKPSSATIKLKTTKKLHVNGGSSGRIKSSQSTNQATRSNGSIARIIKAKSANNLNRTADIKLDEFQIDKVESWMSTHKDTFSDAGLNSYRKNGRFGSTSLLDYKKAWRETPLSKTDDEGNYSLDDQIDNTSIDGSTSGEIELVLKKLQGRCMKISFDSVKSSTSTPTGISQMKSSTNLTSSTGSLNEPTPNKIKQIYQYLDEIDFSCDRTINGHKLRTDPCNYTADLDIDYTYDNDIAGDVPKLSDLVLYSNEQLARKVISLSLRSNELTNAIHMSKEHMEKIKLANQKLVRAEKQATQTRLKEQKNHYETVVARHQEFIEQLLKDKAALCEKVSALVRRIDSQQQTAEHKLQTEIQRVKETALAAEKIRRERWVRDNTKKIKEITVKGLEQELSKMTSGHQKEITELKRQHQQELLEAVDEVRQKHDSVEKSIRENYAQDREHAIERERNAIRERFQRQMEIEQKAFEEHKQRLISEFTVEKERLHDEKQQKECEFEIQRDKMNKDKKDLIDHMSRELNDKIRMMEKRHQSELASVREQFDSDFAIWKREQETTFKLREVENANTIRQQCRAERDKQIDSIVAKVDAETLKIQQDFEVKIGRVKSQYENEMREMERVERQTRDKFTETRSKLAEYEGEMQNLNATTKQLEIQLNHSQKMCDTLATEKEHFKDNARRDIQQDMDTLRKDHEDEIQQIHKRVQHAIEKKEASIDVMRKDNTILKERCIKLETIIRQQRKDYCIK